MTDSNKLELLLTDRRWDHFQPITTGTFTTFVVALVMALEVDTEGEKCSLSYYVCKTVPFIY